MRVTANKQGEQKGQSSVWSKFPSNCSLFDNTALLLSLPANPCSTNDIDYISLKPHLDHDIMILQHLGNPQPSGSSLPLLLPTVNKTVSLSMGLLPQNMCYLRSRAAGHFSSAGLPICLLTLFLLSILPSDSVCTEHFTY